MQERLEAGRVGRLLISVFVACTVAALVVWNMPGSKLRREAMRLAEPYVTAVGLDQNWSVFAPDPYRDSFRLVVRATYADGTRGTWEVPEGGAALGAYWDFRWGKWAEWTLTGNVELCRGTALYAANVLAEEGREPVRLDVVARRRPNARPGVEPAHGAWTETTVCTADVAADEGAP
jgi:hypothetical protein